MVTRVTTGQVTSDGYVKAATLNAEREWRERVEVDERGSTILGLVLWALTLLLLASIAAALMIGAGKLSTILQHRKEESSPAKYGVSGVSVAPINAPALIGQQET